MSSYSKQMMEVAAKWLAVNPDPDDPFIRIPRHERRPEAEANARWKRPVSVDPQVNALADKVEKMQREIEESVAELADAEARAEKALNAAPKARQAKYARDESNISLGRWALAWARHGYNVFDLSQDFVAAMLLTDPSDLDLSRVRLPFGGLLMVIPNGFATGCEGGHYTKIHLCEVPRSAAKLLCVAEQVDEALKGLSSLDRTTALDTLMAMPTRSPLVKPAKDPDDNALHVQATDGAHVLDLMVEEKALSWEAIESLPDEIVDDADKLARHTIRQIVFGTLAYLSATTDAVTPVEAMTKKPRKPGAKATEPKRWDVGRTIRIDRNLVRAARSGAREVAFHIKHRYIVRGHYRNQPFGIRRSEVKRIWIAPFWKGPQDGAALVHTYKLEKENGHGAE